MLQNSKLSALINKVPIFKLTKELAYEFGYKFNECKMPETAGGMLLSVDHEYAEEFSKRLDNEYHVFNWIIGEIDNINEPKRVRVSKDIEHVEITEI